MIQRKSLVMGNHIIAGILAVVFVSIVAHPGRPALQDSPQARVIFQAAERNRTDDGVITPEEFKDIFATFDINTDGEVTEKEFLFIWKDRQLGDLSAASIFFHHIDTDRDNLLSEIPDMSRTFYYFDSNQDGKINLVEFVIVWINLSH
ncbi:uncharacterized protein LOC143063851 [Mytilus galloprovincialis]|uniref:EF-hand domain-containing protein n=1 Tax=Mytilus galloprovincialis TaxID=29158 RepID=A0A8B6FQW8_MYTGA|nr:Hypothetical predicted protein [Mytilus galloprovincialis]